MSQESREPFWPSNSDHGYAFESAFCQKCAAYFGGYCRTLLAAMAHGESPKWVKADNALGGECLGFKAKGEHPRRKHRLVTSAKQPGLFPPPAADEG